MRMLVPTGVVAIGKRVDKIFQSRLIPIVVSYES
jgi:hypothetical protein